MFVLFDSIHSSVLRQFLSPGCSSRRRPTVRNRKQWQTLRGSTPWHRCHPGILLCLLNNKEANLGNQLGKVGALPYFPVFKRPQQKNEANPSISVCQNVQNFESWDSSNVVIDSRELIGHLTSERRKEKKASK